MLHPKPNTSRSSATGRHTAFFVGVLALWITDLPNFARASAFHIWDGSASGYWSTAANWTNNTAPAAGDLLVFPPLPTPGSGRSPFLTTNDFAGTTIFIIAFVGSNYVLHGNVVGLPTGPDPGLVSTNRSGINTVRLGLRLNSSKAIRCYNSSAQLEIYGAIDMTSSPRDLTVGGSGSTRVYGVITGGGGLAKTGPGTLLLGGSSGNAFTGITTVSDGTLELGKSSGEAVRSLIIGNSSGALNAEVVRLQAGEQIGGSVTVNTTGQLDLNNYSDAVGSLTMNGGTITTGTGTLTLGGDLTATSSALGPASIGGVLSLGGTSRTFSIARGPDAHDLVISAVIQDGGSASGFTKSGDGLLDLAGANAYRGATIIDAGRVQLLHGSALGATAAGTVVNTAGRLVVSAVDVGSETLTWNSTNRIEAVGSASWSGSVNLNTTTELFVDSGVFDLRGPVSGTGGVIKTGTGTLRFSGTLLNTYAGDTLVKAGVLELAKVGGDAVHYGSLIIGDGEGGDNADIVRELDHNQIGDATIILIRSSGLLDLNGRIDTVGPLTFQGGNIITGNGTLRLGADITTAFDDLGDIYADWDSSVSGTIDLGSTDRRFVFTNQFDLHLDATLIGSGGIFKTGPGSLHLSASNTFAGPCVVDEGSLYLENGFALGSLTSGTTLTNSHLILGTTGPFSGEAVTVQGFGRLVAYHSCTWPGPINLNPYCSLYLDPNTDSWRPNTILTVTGPISGNGSVIKDYDGTVVFAGESTNTYVGQTRVYGGLLVLRKAGRDRAVPGHLIIESLAIHPGEVRLEADDQISDSSDVTIEEDGLVSLVGGAHETIGGLYDVSDTFWGEAAALDLGAGGLAFGRGYFNGPITGVGGSLEKYGSSAFVLRGTNTYTGLTRVREGSLFVHGPQPFSPVEVLPTAMLGGTGVVGHLTVQGQVAPGNSPGRLACSNLTLQAGSTYRVELNGAAPGTGYDQLDVRGSVELGGAALSVSFGFPPSEGEQFVVVNNDGYDPVSGTFAGLPNGAVLTANALQLQINYAGGSGNDVVLTVTNTALRGSRCFVTTGNLNGAVDPNECNLLYVVVTNVGPDLVTGVSASLVSRTPGVSVMQIGSPYPDMPAGDARLNAIPFQVSTLPGFMCGRRIDLDLIVSTADHGFFTIPVLAPSGLPGTAVRFDSYGGEFIESYYETYSWLYVGGLTGPVRDIAVSLHLTHPADEQLELLLQGPDGTVVELSTGNGGTNANYGTGCSNELRTVFSDSALVPITAGSAPFLGAFRPEQPLSAFLGRFGQAVSGGWSLRIKDNTFGASGWLNCWSLFLTPALCGDPEGGPCEACPAQTVQGVAGTALQIGSLQSTVPSRCGVPKSCPGEVVEANALARSYDSYTFLNGESNACITVTLSSEYGMFSAAYSNSYDPFNLCENYLADAGWLTANGAPRSYAFEARAGAVFVVAVWSDGLRGTQPYPYTLQVSGGSCRPLLNMGRAAGNKVLIDWSTAGVGWKLEATNLLVNLPHPGWTGVTNEPAVINSRFRVTNNVPPNSQRFYQLRKP